jgi:hypothetical protein
MMLYMHRRVVFADNHIAVAVVPLLLPPSSMISTARLHLYGLLTIVTTLMDGFYRTTMTLSVVVVIEIVSVFFGCRRRRRHRRIPPLL